MKSREPTFLAVDFLDLDVIEIKGETMYHPGNGFWFVRSRDNTWHRLWYADAVERLAIREELRHRIRAFERTLK